MKLLASIKTKMTKDEHGKNTPHLDIIEVVLVHCNFVYNDYQEDLRVLYSFVSNKSFGQLLDILPENFIFLKTLIQNFRILKNGLLIKILNR